MKYIILLILHLLQIVWAEIPVYEYRMNVILVTGQIPTDGHLRFFRSLQAFNINTHLVQCADKSQDLVEIVRSLDELNFAPDEVLTITTSSDMVPGREAAVLAWRIMGEVMRHGMKAIVSAPKDRHPPIKDIEDIDQQIEDIQLQLDRYRRNGIRIKDIRTHSLQELEEVKVLIKEQQILQVKSQQKLRLKTATFQPNLNNFTNVALSGMASSVTAILKESLLRHYNSLEDLWKAVILDKKIAAELKIARDLTSNIIENLKNRPNAPLANLEIRRGIDGSLLVQTEHNVLKLSPPLIYTPLGSFSYPIYNMHSGEIGKKKSCAQCPDEKYLWNEKIPEVHISIQVSAEAPFLPLFLLNLHKLSYSKDKIHLRFIIQNERKHYRKIKEFLKLHSHEYKSTAVLEKVARDSEKVSFEQIWNEASIFGSYLFILDSSVYLDFEDMIQYLITKNRNVIGPLLKNHENSSENEVQHNIMTNYQNREFGHGSLTDMFINKLNDGTANFNGLLQVAYISHAVMVSPRVLQKLHITYRDDESLLMQSTMEQLLIQGFIPYAVNEEEFGFFVSIKEYSSDIEYAAANNRGNEITQLYFRNPGDYASQDISERCKGVLSSSILTTNLTSDLEDSIARSWYYISAEDDEIDIIKPKPKVHQNFQNVASMILQKIKYSDNHFQGDASAVQVPLIIELAETIDGSEEPVIYKLPKEARTVVLLCISHPQFSKGCILDVPQEEKNCRVELEKAEALIIQRDTIDHIFMMLPHTLLQILE